MNRSVTQLLDEMGLNPSKLVTQDSITTHNWCDSSSWPSANNSLYELTAQGMSGLPTDNKAVYMPKGILRCMNTSISASNPLILKYYIGTICVSQTVYSSLEDFQKRATSGGITFIPNVKDNTGTGDIWEILLSFEDDGKPVVIWPVSMADLATGKLTKITIETQNDVPYGKVEEPGATPWAYVRYPGLLILDTPEQ